MMKDIKNCFKLYKYGYQAKTNAGCGLLFVVIGILFVFMTGYDQLILCSVYLFLGILFISQTMYMMLFSEFVAASPGRKKVEFRYMDIINVIGGVFATVVTLLLAFLAKPAQIEGATTEAMLVISGAMAIIMYCYMSMSYKWLVFGTALFMIAFFSAMNMSEGKVNEILSTALEGKTLLAVVIFLVEVVIGLLLAHGIRRLLYKKGMSKFAAGYKLQMEQMK